MPLLNLNLRSVIFGQDGTSFFSVLSDLCGGCELETGGGVANTVSFTLLAIKYVNNLVIYTNTNTVGMNAFLKLNRVTCFTGAQDDGVSQLILYLIEIGSVFR